MSEDTNARLFCWEDMPAESVTDVIDRRLVTGERSMMAYLNLAKGSIVPQHSHDNEQFTYVLKGALKFWLGENGEDVRVVNEGQVLHIPPNLPHKAEAPRSLRKRGMSKGPRLWLTLAKAFSVPPLA